MTDALIVGGGVVGMGLGMMLARDGHTITMLERDPEPVPSGPDDAWERWERKGVTQFRLSHFFLARYRQILEAELPTGRDGDRAGRRSASQSVVGHPRIVQRWIS